MDGQHNAAAGALPCGRVMVEGGSAELGVRPVVERWR
jgi:hypothetical protein